MVNAPRLWCVLLLVVLVLASPSATANDPLPIRRSDQLHVSVPVANFTVYRLDVDADHTVTFSIRVTQGPALDVLLLSLPEYHTYEDRLEGNASAEPSPIHQWMGTVYVQSAAPHREGFYLLVLDNTDFPQNGTSAVVPIEVQLLVRFSPRQTTDPTSFVPLLAAAAVALTLLGAWYLHRLYRQEVTAAAAVPPPPPAAPRRPPPPVRQGRPPPSAPPRMRYSDGSSARHTYPQAPPQGPHQQRLAHQQRQHRGPQRRPEAGTYGARPSQQEPLPTAGPGELALRCGRCATAFLAEELERPFETQCPVCGRWELVR